MTVKAVSTEHHAFGLTGSGYNPEGHILHEWEPTDSAPLKELHMLLRVGLLFNESRLFHNFFCPSVKLIAKERVGSKTVKRYDIPRTPYQRIMLSNHIPESIKQPLAKELENLNPFVLRQAMEEKLKKIFIALHLG